MNMKKWQFKIEKSKSFNVLATLPGSEYPDEHIIYTAHWDHLGTDATKDGDQIYNGAHDNPQTVSSQEGCKEESHQAQDESPGSKRPGRFRGRV